MIPVWINRGKNKSSKNYYLQPACIGRRTYYNTFEDLAGKKKPCELSRENKDWVNDKQLCPACKIFGTVKKDAIGSRLRFTDAYMTNGNITENYKTLSILSSPKATFLPFYAKIKGNNPNISFEGYDSDCVSIKGRKFYLHSDSFEELNKDIEISNQNMSAKIAEKNSEFKFKIFFDNITEDDLLKLIWAVNIGENDSDGKYCHKIGHGKPIDLGSVKITVESVNKRTFENGHYSEDNFSEILEKDAGLKEAYINEFKIISDFETAKRLDKTKGIHYPPGGFKWFQKYNKLNSSVERLLDKYSEILKGKA